MKVRIFKTELAWIFSTDHEREYGGMEERRDWGREGKKQSWTLFLFSHPMLLSFLWACPLSLWSYRNSQSLQNRRFVSCLLLTDFIQLAIIYYTVQNLFCRATTYTIAPFPVFIHPNTVPVLTEGWFFPSDHFSNLSKPF